MTATATPPGPTGTNGSNGNYAGQNINLTLMAQAGQAPTPPGSVSQGVKKPDCLVLVAEGLYYDKCRSYYTPSTGYGRVVLAVENDREYVLEVRSDGDATYLSINVDGVQLAQPLSKLKSLLKPQPLKNLAPYRDVIESLILGMISNTERLVKYVPTVASKEVPIGNDRLYIGLKADGSIVLRFGGNVARADGEGGLARALAQLLPPNLVAQYGQVITNEVKQFMEEVSSRGYIKVGDVVVSIEENEIYMLYNTVIINDKLVMLIPINASIIGSGASRDSIPVLVITSDGNNVQLSMAVTNPRSPVEVWVDNKTLVRDFYGQFSSARDIRPYLPDGRLIRYVRMYLDQPPSIDELTKMVTEYLDKYVELQEREHELAKLFAIAQAFYDAIHVYPLVAILGEKGSGKKQFGNAMASLMPIYVRTGNVTPAILYRLTTALAPALVLDETESTLRENPELLNMGYEADILVQRARPTEAGHKIESFTVYGPKYIVGKPTTLYVREDTESRMIYFNMVRSKKYYPPVDPHSEDRYRLAGALIAFKAKYWRVFKDAYTKLKQELVGFDQRFVDDYLPPLTIAYLRGDRCLVYNVLRDMVRNYIARRENLNLLTIVTYGVLGKVLEYRDSGGVVREVRVKVKDIIGIAGNYLPIDPSDDNLYLQVGRYLSQVYKTGEGFVIGRREAREGTEYTIDAGRLFEYVRRYDIDLSFFRMQDLMDLEKLTGLKWMVASNLDRWVMCVMKRLYLNGKPVLDCMESGDSDFTGVEELLRSCKLWGQSSQSQQVEASKSEEKVGSSSSVGQAEASQGQPNQEQSQPGGTNALAPESSITNPPGGGDSTNDAKPEAGKSSGQSQPVSTSNARPEQHAMPPTSSGFEPMGMIIEPGSGNVIAMVYRPLSSFNGITTPIYSFFERDERYCRRACETWHRDDQGELERCVKACLECKELFDPNHIVCYTKQPSSTSGSVTELKESEG